MDPLEHLTGPGARGGQSVTECRVLTLEIGQPKLEVKGAKVWSIPLDDGLFERPDLMTTSAGGEVAGRATYDDFQLAERRDLRSNVVGRQAQPPELEESAPADRRSL
jgi:hypothetical protein